MTSFVRRFGAVFGLTAVGYVLSFCSQLVISYYFGTSSALDSYWAGLALVNLACFYLNPLREALVPAVHRAAAHSEEEGGKLLSAGLSLLGVLVAGSTLLLAAFSDQFVLLISGAGGETGELLLRLLPWLLPYLWLFALSETLNMTLTSFDRMVLQASARVLGGAVLIVTIAVLGSRLGIPALMIAQIANLSVVALLALVALRRLRLRVHFHCLQTLRGSGVFSLFGALTITYFFSQIYGLVERWAMIHVSSGLVSAFQYSTALANTLLSLVAFPLANLLWPRFLAAQRGEGVPVGDLALRAAFCLCAVLIVACTLIWARAEEIVRILFARGAFDAQSVQITSSTLRAVIFAAIPIGLATLLGRLLISLRGGHRILWVGLASTSTGLTFIAVSILIDREHLVIWHWLAANCASLAVTLVLFARSVDFQRASIVVDASRILVVGVIVAFAAWITPSLEFGSGIAAQIGALIVETSVYAVVVVVLAFMLKLDKWYFGLLRGRDAKAT